MKTHRSVFITDDCRLNPHGESASRHDTFNSLVLCLLITCVAQPMVATAQITLISPGGSVEKAANGVTLIQIPTPSAAGVSHLLYEEFNSPSAGMVFNNSPIVVQSQLAGFNEGNPNLATGGARTLLNEIVGPLPSQLNGYMEIAGRPAELIVANPNGITCNGCGFINTTRGVLTTGIPLFGAGGSLDALRVIGGQINVNGAGLNGSNTAQIDLIARAVRINADFWGQQLNVIAGANQVAHADLSTTAMSSSSPAPAVAVDVAALGGMYANSIRLVGTEAGVGVVSDGTLAAQAGDMSIDSAGYLTVTGTTQARGRIELRAEQDLSHSGTLYAQGDAQLVSQAQISNRGTIAAQGDLSLDAESIASSGVLAAGMTTNGRFDSQGDLRLAARDSVGVRGTQVAGRNIDVSGRMLDLAGATTWAGNDVSLNAGAGSIDHQGASLDAGGKVSLHSQGSIDNRRAVIKSKGRGGLALSSRGAIDNTRGYLSANDTLTVAAEAFANTAGTLINLGSGRVQLSAGGSIDNTAGYIGGRGDIDISVTQLSNAQGEIAALNDLSLATSTLGGAGLIMAERDLSLNFNSDANNAAGNTLKANRNLTLASVGDFINQGAIEAVGKLSFASASLDNRNGATINAEETVISARDRLDNAGSIQGSALSLAASDLSNSGWIQGTHALALQAADLDNAGPRAVIIGNGTLDILISNALSNRDGATLYSLGDLNLGASTRHDADGYMADSMERFINSSAWVQTGGELRLSARQIINTRRLLDVQWGAERTGESVRGNPRYTSYYASEYVTEATTPAAQLLSDSHMWLKGNILNEYSYIAAGGDLNHNPQQLTQTARALMEKQSDRGEQDNLQWVKVGEHCTKRFLGTCISRADEFDWRNIPIPYNQEKTYAIGSVDSTLTANKRQPGKAVDINNQTVSSTNGNAITLDSRAATAGGGAADTPLALPVSGLFHYRSGPGHPYLIETDPRFANFGQFMSSDYMLARLKFDPQQIQKRLGDAQVEQKRISDQILAQTGHRYLEGYTDADSEFLALMESGLEVADDLHLRPGIALTAAQLDALGKNIVWLVEQSVDLPGGGSERVLVPVVYLTRHNSFELKPNGALIAAADLDLRATSTIVNSGTLRGQEHLRLAAADILNRQGRIVSDGVTEALAANDLVNQSSTVQGRQLSLAAGRDLHNERLTEGVQLGATATTRIFDASSLSTTDAATPGVQIQAGRDVIMAAGNVSSASDTRIVAGRKLSIGTVAAREQIASGPSQRGQETQLVSTLESAGHLNLVAASDATLTAAHVTAGQDLSLVAGGNIALKAAKDTTSSAFDNGESTKNRYYDEHAKGSQLVAGGNLQMAAVALSADRHDAPPPKAERGKVSLEAATLQAGDGVRLVADDTVSIAEASERHEAMQELRSSQKGFFKSSTTTDRSESTRNAVVGSRVVGENVTLQSGASGTNGGKKQSAAKDTPQGDITVRGSAVQATKAMQVAAGRDIVLESAQENSTRTTRQSRQEKKSGLTGSLFNGTGLNTYTDAHEANVQHTTRAVGSTLSAGTLETRSGRDTHIEGSALVADGEVDLAAVRHLSLLSAQNTADSQSSSESRSSGSIGSWWQPAVGNVRQNQHGDSQTVGQSVSQVASLSGDVTLNAGQHYIQGASDVLAPEGDIDIHARQIDILAASNSQRATETREYRKSAVGGSVSVPLINTAMSLASLAQTSKQTSDPRMKALAAATLAIQAKTVADSAQALANGSLGGVKVTVSVGRSANESRSTQASQSVAGSTVAAGRDARLTASGGGQDSDVPKEVLLGDLTVEGSTVSAGKKLSLIADDELRLQAAANTAEMKNSNRNSNSSVGVGFAFGGAQNGWTLEVAASKGRGHADGSDLAWTNTHVNAGDQLLLQSGGDTTLKGAVARAPQVTADVGGNLNITSLQDTSTFDAEQKSAGFTLSLCVPPFCYGASSGSVSSAKNQISSDFASVGEQSGIKAGDQGFQVAVKGDTALTGAVIASTDKAVDEGKNRFTTGGMLKTEDIQNLAEYDALGYAVTVSGSTKLGDQTSKAAQSKMSAADKAAAASKTSGLGPSALSGAGVAEASDQAASTTRAGISGIAGNTAVRSDDAESGIKPIFKADKVQTEINAQVQITQAFRREAVAVASVLTHEAYRTMFLQKVEVREIMRDEHGNFLRSESGELQTRVVPQEEKTRLRACDDGKVHIANNGIFNNLSEAAKNAQQHSTASGPQYLIVFPQANNAVSELLVAGYQKFLEGGMLGLTNATKENIDMLDQYGQSGLHIDGHSRGALTTQNALEFKSTEDDSSGSASNTTVSFFGPAANAAATDQALSVLQNRTSVSDPQIQQDMVLKLQNHSNDPIGTIIGNNPGTGGNIPQTSNSFTEAMKALTGQDFTTHNCYGGSAPVDCQGFWGNGKVILPINQLK